MVEKPEVLQPKRKIHTVILCGGAGARLWPVSRKAYPKQFVQLVGKSSLFQAAIRNFSGPDFAAPIIVTGNDFRFVVTEQLVAIGTVPEAILIEPEPRNTAPAILAAALVVWRSDPQGVILVAPSDHAIADPEAFRAAVRAGLPAVEAGQIVTFGIRPTRPETGYGWLELAGPADDGVAPLNRFVEKPDLAHAEEMAASGNFLWNSGIFMSSAATMLAAFRAHAPKISTPVEMAVDRAEEDLQFLRLDPEVWASVEANSIDYAIMEKASNLSVVPCSAGWNDLGSWNAVAQEMNKDAARVASSGSVTAIDCHDSLLRSDSDGVEVVGLGLADMIVVAMKDAVLVADRTRAQDVRQAVEALKAKQARQAEAFLHDHRPWGHFESLASGERFQVKRIVVHPGAALSLQSHKHRAEHWIVVSGTARVTIKDEVRLVGENQSVYVPLGAKHRLENPGQVPMVLIEVQTGSYLGEDDIFRYEDVYGRRQGVKG